MEKNVDHTCQYVMRLPTKYVLLMRTFIVGWILTNMVPNVRFKRCKKCVMKIDSGRGNTTQLPPGKATPSLWCCMVK